MTHRLTPPPLAQNSPNRTRPHACTELPRSLSPRPCELHQPVAPSLPRRPRAPHGAAPLITNDAGGGFTVAAARRAPTQREELRGVRSKARASAAPSQPRARQAAPVVVPPGCVVVSDEEIDRWEEDTANSEAWVRKQQREARELAARRGSGA